MAVFDLSFVTSVHLVGILGKNLVYQFTYM